MFTHDDRRSSPRIEMLNRLQGHVGIEDTPVTVREISLGGMSLQTSSALPVGSVQEFRLRLGDGSTVLLQGRVLRCRLVSEDGQPPEYVSGVQFVGDDAGDSAGGLIGQFS